MWPAISGDTLFGVMIAAPLCAYGIVALYALQIRVTALAAAHGVDRADSMVMIATGLLQCLLLAILYRSLQTSTLAVRIAVFSAAPFLAGLSLISADTNVDGYAYVGYGLVPRGICTTRYSFPRKRIHDH